MKSADRHVLIYGDLFVDYIATDETNTKFTAFLGGATINVAAGVSRLGAKASLITIIGEHEDAKMAERELQREGVDLAYAVRSSGKKVSGVYVHLTAEHDRVFAKYVDETPDLQVKPEELDEQAFRDASVLHICSGTMFQPTALATTKRAVELAKSAGALLSFDPNIRPLRWESEEICRETILEFLPQADVLKVTEEELEFLMQAEGLDAALERLAGYGVPVVMLTLGEKGTLAVIDGVRQHVGVEAIEPVDTTGAGDAFIAGVLRGIQLYGKPESQEEWLELISFGNRMGALCTMKPGALSAMPHAAELDGQVGK